ncbi:type II secretion system F family protein [Methylobacterium sp. HMF5984]|uniref:type II secretion system F family protein n=1 Tax=Methylobacterium sp. HMF5984 TaxID=3367370 RepID=UPI0038555A00
MLIYLAVFAGVAFAVQQGQIAASTLLQGRSATRRRLDALAGDTMPDEPAALRRRASRLGTSAPARALARLFLQSGTAMTPAGLGSLVAGLAVVLFVALPLPSAPLRLLAALIAASSLVLAWLRVKRARRIASFGEQLPEVLDVITRSLRAGHPLPVSMALVAREMPEPAKSEFALVVDEVNYGRSFTEALENLYQRVGYPELRFVVAAVSIGHQTGGNLGEILARLSRMLRDRFRLSRKVRALSAEGRFSGYALSILPVGLFALINILSPAYYAEFWKSPSSSTVLAISLVLLLIGNAVILRLVNLKV